MRLIYVLFVFVYFLYYFYDNVTVIILFIVWIRFHRRILTKHPQNCKTDKDYYQHYIILCNLEIIQVNSY